MANGRLGSVLLPSNTWTVAYTCPAGMRACVNVNALSRAGSAQALDLYLAIAGSATNQGGRQSIIEYDFAMTNGTVLERTAILLSAGQSITARCSATGSSMAVTVWGYEESDAGNTGRVAAIELPSATWTVAYTCPTAMVSMVTINNVGITPNTAQVRLAVETSATTNPLTAAHIEQNAEVGAGVVLERTAIVLEAGHSIIARATSGSAIACVVWALEESAS